MAHVKRLEAVTENEERKNRMRRRLMSAAIEVIAKKGFPASQPREIVKRARVSTGIFYFYFKDKRDIFLKILEENIDLLQQILEKRLLETRGASDLREALGGIYGAYFDFIDAHPKLFLCLFRSGAYVEPGFGELLERIMAESALHARRRLELGIQAGLVREDLDLNVLARAIGGMLVEVGHSYILGKMKRREAVETLVAFSVSGLQRQAGHS